MPVLIPLSTQHYSVLGISESSVYRIVIRERRKAGLAPPARRRITDSAAAERPGLEVGFPDQRKSTVSVGKPVDN